MLTTKDLQNIDNLIAARIVPLEEKIDVLDERTESLVTAVDGIRKNLDEQEYAALKLNDSKQDQKIQELAEHTNYTFKTP